MPLCLISLPRTFSAQGPVSYLLKFMDLGVYIVIRLISMFVKTYSMKTVISSQEFSLSGGTSNK